MPLQPDFQNQKHLGFIWDPGLTGTPSRRGKAPSTMSREVLLSRRANSFFPQITWILDWKNAFCALKKTVAPFFVCLFVCFWLLFFCFSRYQEKWTHGTKENSFSESQLFACLGEGAGVAPKGPSPRGGRALFSAEMVFVCHSPIFPLESFLFLFSILFVRVSDFIYNFFAARALCPRGDTHGQWLFVAALVSISNGRHWKPLSYLVCFRIPKGHFLINFIFPSFLIPIFLKEKTKRLNMPTQIMKQTW